MLYFALFYAAIIVPLVILQARTRPVDLGVDRVRRYDWNVHAVGMGVATLPILLFLTLQPRGIMREDVPMLSMLAFVTWWIVAGIGTGLRRRMLRREKHAQTSGL